MLEQSAIDEAISVLQGDEGRLVSIFGSLDPDNRPRVHYIIDLKGRDYRVLSSRLHGPLPSATRITPAAAWYERELHDQYGIEIVGHPDLRPLVHHENWPDGVFPMAKAVGAVPFVKRPYEFLKVEGEGVCEVPVGPVHAGIIEPGHFRFSVVGDTVLHLELRHFYTHKGTERLFQDASVLNGTMLAESVSGDNCFAHAVAYCQAVENAFGISATPRGRAIRLLGLEAERMVAHIADVGALCGDVGFTVPAAYNSRLKESILQASTMLVGTRFWRGIAVPGGVKRDISTEEAREFGRIVSTVAREFSEMAHTVLETPSVQNRFESTGILKPQVARDMAVVGPVARASGINFDVRRDHPYGPYRKIAVDVPCLHYGDVLARARIRIEETAISARLIDDVINALPTGDPGVRVNCDGSAEGFSAVESPRGELLYWIQARDGQTVRCHIKSPSFQNWPALPLAMQGNIIADFPLINKSFNLSYSGCDR
jgi:Ni,Fe-hydrogenase III large subunit